MRLDKSCTAVLGISVVQPSQLPVDDEPHDLIGALQYAVHTQVSQVAT
jgi:hypothetical protein